MKQTINKLFVFILFAMLILSASCSNSGTRKTENKKETTSDTTRKKEEGITELTEKQIKSVGIEIGLLEQKNLTSAVNARGQLTVPPQNRAVVNALVGGVIKKINVIEGQYVKTGQVVATIENPDFTRLQQDYLTTKDNLVYLAQEYERQRQLKESGAGIGKVYQQASANYAAEKSKLTTLEKQLEQIHINPSEVSKGTLITQVPILAPIGGTVGHIKLSVGTYTDAASPIMEIVNNNTIYCDLQVYEKDIAKVKAGQKVNFTLTNQNDKQITGKVYGINKSFETDNKAVIVHTQLNRAASLNLIPGMYVSALIETGKQLVTAVPKEAIVKANDKKYVYVFEGTENEIAKDEQGKNQTKKKYRFRQIEVVTGAEESGYVEIKPIEELSTDAKIVTKGAFYIYSSMQKGDTDDLM